MLNPESNDGGVTGERILDPLVACSRVLFNPKSSVGGATGECLSGSLDAYSKSLFVLESKDGGKTENTAHKRPQLAEGSYALGGRQLHAAEDLNWL